MLRDPRNARRKAGFTLIELLVVSVAMIFVMVLTMNSFSAHRNTYAVIDDVSQVHQNSIAIASLVERDIRQAGYMVPKGAAACGLDATDAADVLLVSDTDAIRTADALPADLAGSELSAGVSGFPGGTTGTVSLSAQVPPQDATASALVLDAQATYDADAAVAGPDSDFRPGGGVIFFNATADPPIRCGVVGLVDAGAETIEVTLVDGAGDFPGVSAGWVAVPGHLYRINGTQLQRDGVLLADDVDDLQLAWFYDGDDDGQVDAGEYLGNSAADQLQLDSLPNDDPSLLREIRLNVVVRTAGNDPTNPTSTGVGQATENQTVVPGVDGRRRRVHVATVRLRNLTS